jgi:hypothetical protein
MLSLVPYCLTLWTINSQQGIMHQIRGETQGQHGLILRKTLIPMLLYVAKWVCFVGYIHIMYMYI